MINIWDITDTNTTADKRLPVGFERDNLDAGAVRGTGDKEAVSGEK